jgi:hypothetical protein
MRGVVSGYLDIEYVPLEVSQDSWVSSTYSTVRTFGGFSG